VITPRNMFLMSLLVVLGGGIGPSSGSDASLDGLVRPLAEAIIDGGAPGIIVMRRGDAGIETAAFGLANMEHQTPMTTDLRFRAGSITKMLVATIVCQLAGEGAIALDSPVASYLPNLLNDDDPTTVRHLLGQRSGIAEYWNDPDFQSVLYSDPTYEWAPEDLARIGTRQSRLYPAGEGWTYANTNYVLLGLLIEAVTGEALGAVVDTRILQPLGLRGTSFDTHPQIEGGSFANGYDKLGGDAPVDITLVSPTAAWGAGNVVATAHDLTAFLAALLQSEILDAGLLAEMMEVMPTNADFAYGLGIGRFELSCGSAWGHRGDFAGYQAIAVSDETGRRQTVVFANSTSLSDAGSRAFLDLVDWVFCESVG
jgi:D-alanyl-D-alanine carboxypeptidase